MKNCYVVLLLILSVIITSFITNDTRNNEEFFSKNKVEVTEGICTFKQYNGNVSAINLDNGKHNQSVLVTEKQYNDAQIGKKYNHKMVILNGCIDSIHLEEVRA